MNKINIEQAQEIIEEAAVQSTLKEEMLFFMLGVEAYYSQYNTEERYQHFEKDYKLKRKPHPAASRNYKNDGLVSFEKLLPLIQSICCDKDKPKKSIARTLALTEIVSVLRYFFDRATIVTIISIIIKQGLDEICSVKFY